MIVLETDRLTLRHLTTADAPFMLTLLNDPSFIANIADRGVRTVAEAQTYLQQGPIASYNQNGFGLYLVMRKDDDASVGICGLVKRDGLDDVDIGYAFLPPFWGKGYAVEAATAVKTYAQHTLKLPKLVAITDPNNDPSIRVLQKIGLTFTGKVRLSADDMELNLYSCDFA